jgi:DNA anti-recombination protein RmuC
MGGHIGDLGEGLQKAITKYNSFIGSLEGSVLPQARKFEDLHVEGTKEDLAVLEPVQTEPRLLTPGRDMILVLSEEARTAVGSAQPIRPTPNGDDRITA